MKPIIRVEPARYAKNQMAVYVLDSKYGFKGRASKLCEVLKGKWTHREGAYIMSPTKVEKLKLLIDAGWYGGIFGVRFISPDGERFSKFPKELKS